MLWRGTSRIVRGGTSFGTSTAGILGYRHNLLWGRWHYVIPEVKINVVKFVVVLLLLLFVILIEVLIFV